jgi:metal-responsive CopG/Arc/MetJ family transcriptional regulator
MTRLIAFKTSIEQLEKLQQACKQRGGCSMSSLIREALEVFLTKEENLRH